MPFCQPSRSIAAARGSAAARLARSVALLLLLIQALVVPAHRHASVAPSVAAAHATLVTPTKGRTDHPADCPICREVAHSGQYLTPDGLAFAEVATPGMAPAALTLASVEATTRSHAWRSRAPPVSAFS